MKDLKKTTILFAGIEFFNGLLSGKNYLIRYDCRHAKKFTRMVYE